MNKFKANVPHTVQLPENALALANSLVKLATTLIHAEQSGISGPALIASIGISTLTELSSSLASVGGITSEAKNEPVAVAEAFAIAGFTITRSLTNQ